jgi:hypothetical protein
MSYIVYSLLKVIVKMAMKSVPYKRGAFLEGNNLETFLAL